MTTLSSIDSRFELMHESHSMAPDRKDRRMKQLEQEIHTYRQNLMAKDEEINGLKSKQLKHTSSSLSNRQQLNDDERRSLQNQIEKSNNMLVEKTRQYEKLYKKYNAVQNQMVTLQDYASDLERQGKFLADKLNSMQIHAQGDEDVVGQLENKLVLMSTEIMRMGHMNRTKTQQLSQLKFKMQAQEQDIEVRDQQIKEKDELIIRYRDEIRRLEAKAYQIQSDKEYNAESTNKQLAQEIERLNTMLASKSQEIGTLTHKMQVLESQRAMLSDNITRNNRIQFQEELENYRRSAKLHNEDMLKIQQNLSQTKNTNTMLQQQIHHHKRRVADLQYELNQVTTKLNNLNEQNNENIRVNIQMLEIDKRKQYHIIENLKRQKEEREVKYKEEASHCVRRFEQETMELRSELSRGSEKIVMLQNRLEKFEEKIVMFSQEMHRLNVSYQESQQEVRRLKEICQGNIVTEQKLKESQRAKESLIAELRQSEDQAQRIRRQLKEAQDQNSQLEMGSFQTDVLKADLRALTLRLEKKQEQSNFLNQKAQQFQSLYNQNDERQKDYEYKLQKMTEQNSQATNKYKSLAQEIERLNEVIANCTQNALGQKREISLLQNNLSESENSLKMLRKNSVPMHEIEQQIEFKVNTYKKEVQMSREENMVLKSRISELEIMNSSLKKESESLNQLYIETKDRLHVKEQETFQIANELAAIKRKQSSNIQNIKQVNESNRRLEGKMAKLSEEFRGQVSQKNQKIESLQQDISLWEQRSRGLEADSVQCKHEIASLNQKIVHLHSRQQQLLSRITKQAQSISELESAKQQLSNERMKLQMFEQDVKRLSYDYENSQSIRRELQNKTNNLQHQYNLTKQANKELQKQLANKVAEQEHKINEIRLQIRDKQGQISVLKNKLGDMNTINLQKEKHYGNLLQKKDVYEEKVVLLSQELERLQVMVDNKNEAIDAMNKEIDKYSKNADYASQAKKMIDVLASEITRLNDVLGDNIQKIQQADIEVQEMELQIKRNLAQYKGVEDNLKNQLTALSQENQHNLQERNKLNVKVQTLSRKIQDFQKLEENNTSDLQRQLHQLSVQKHELLNTVTDLQAHIRNLSDKTKSVEMQNYSLVSRKEIMTEELSSDKVRWEKKVSMLVIENQQLSKQISINKHELEQYERELSSVRKQIVALTSQNDIMVRQRDQYQLTHEQISSKLSEFMDREGSQRQGSQRQSSQLSQLRERNHQLQLIINDYQSKIAMMSQEIQRLTLQLDERNQATSLNGANNERSQKYEILESIHLKLKRQCETLKDKVNEYEYKMSKLKMQFELLNKITHEYKDENQYLRNCNHTDCIYVGERSRSSEQHVCPVNDAYNTNMQETKEFLIKKTLNSEIDRLNILNEGLRRQTEEARSLSSDHEALKVRVQEMLCSIVLLSAQAQALRGRNVEKIKQ